MAAAIAAPPAIFNKNISIRLSNSLPHFVELDATGGLTIVANMVATTGTTVSLPRADMVTRIQIINATSKSMYLVPYTGDGINSTSADVGILIPVSIKTVTLESDGRLTWSTPMKVFK